MADRNSDLVTLLRQVLTDFAKNVETFENLAGEFQLRTIKGKFQDFEDEKGEPIDLPKGHNDITLAELSAAVEAVAKILADTTQEQKDAVQLVRI